MNDFKFMVSVFDLIDNPVFANLCRLLHLDIPSAWLEQEYDHIYRGQGDVFLFQSLTGCLLLDLFQELTDQNEMVVVGIRCPQELYTQVKKYAQALYQQAPVKSVRLEEGPGLLDTLLAPENYPLARPSLTTLNGQETTVFLQHLQIFQF